MSLYIFTKLAAWQPHEVECLRVYTAMK